MSRTTQHITLVGFGAIGQGIYERVRDLPNVFISDIVVRAKEVETLQARLGQQVRVCSQVPADTTLVLECAGHAALVEHVLPALRAGMECAVLSVGALSESGLPEQLAQAAHMGGTQLHLLSGAVGGIDAIASARMAGLREVTYTGRKPPQGWRGSHAEQVLDLDALTGPTLILDATAREAARLYPKNANVAATVSLAGLGLDATRVRLIADPGITENIHEVEVAGEFGKMKITMMGKPMPNNPKTSMLTLLSALRFLHNRVAKLTT